MRLRAIMRDRRYSKEANEMSAFLNAEGIHRTPEEMESRGKAKAMDNLNEILVLTKKSLIAEYDAKTDKWEIYLKDSLVPNFHIMNK